MKIVSKPESQALHMVDANEKHVGELNYAVKDQKMIITHTGIKSEYGGKGLGKELVGAGIHLARENNWKVKAYCSFAKRYLKDHQEECADIIDEKE